MMAAQRRGAKAAGAGTAKAGEARKAARTGQPAKAAHAAAGFFEPKGTRMGARLRRLHALYDIAYTLVDFSAAVLFIVGSWMFFYASLMTAGTWLFLIGSVLFAVRPTLRLAREIATLRHPEENTD